MAKDVISEKASVSDLEGYSGRKRIATGKPYFSGDFSASKQTGDKLKSAPDAKKESHPFKSKSPRG